MSTEQDHHAPVIVSDEARVRTLTLNRPDVETAFPAVCLDDRPGVAAAVRHLLELGHTRIAHVAGTAEFLHGTGRRTAWEETLAEAGVSPGPVAGSDFTAAGGAAATRRLLDLADQPERSCADADGIARAHRVEIDEKIARLTALRAELKHMVDEGEHGRVAECRVIEALGDHAGCLHEAH